MPACHGTRARCAPAGSIPDSWGNATSGGTLSYARLSLSNNQLTGVLPGGWGFRGGLLYSSRSVELCCQGSPGMRGPMPYSWAESETYLNATNAKIMRLDLRCGTTVYAMAAAALLALLLACLADQHGSQPVRCSLRCLVLLLLLRCYVSSILELHVLQHTSARASTWRCTLCVLLCLPSVFDICTGR